MSSSMLSRDHLRAHAHAHAGTLEALQNHQLGPTRRARPPDLNLMATEENRIPLRPEKVSKRESRLGLRNIFTRSKANKDHSPSLSPLEIPKLSASRTSIADLSNTQSNSGSDHTPSTPRSPRILSTMFENSTAGPPPVKVLGPARATRGPLATWSPPPLFKAFPQALKHSTLPTASLPTEVILRLHERRNAAGENPAEPPAEPDTVEKLLTKKKHRHNASASLPKFEWANKIYILATSGYLLQYSAEGPFDRLPEKILHLGKNSAAFASDVIPGRHWVIHVSSAMDSDGTAASDSKKIFSRMTFRVTERRQSSNFILVFESAEDMEGWLAALRREIEILGGKKTLTETGKPKAEGEATQLREQPSQRTLVVRDPARLSRVLAHNQLWQESIDNEGSVTVSDPDTIVDPAAMDDMSTTNSFVSHDGRQLENLRDSSNRFSFISSGQRTVVTSAASSSPESSPTTDKFPTQFEQAPEQQDTVPPLEPRPRPNAAAILDRRQSMQVMAPFVDLRGGPVNLRSQPAHGGPSDVGMPVPARASVTPNFSVPNTSARRFSYMRNQDPGMLNQPVIRETESMPRLSSRKNPPTTLSITRPLSMVVDQPSPLEAAAVLVRPATRHGEETAPPRASEEIPLPDGGRLFDLPARRSSIARYEDAQVEVNRSFSSRRLSNVSAWRKPDHPPLAMSRSFTSPIAPPIQRARSRPSLPGLDEQPRCASSLELTRNGRDTSSTRARSRKRASIQSIMSENSSRYSISADFPAPMVPEMLPQPVPPPLTPLPPLPTSTSNPHLRAEKNSKALLAGRRSMPQLTDGPPPAPPPTCALPPIPQKVSVNV